MNPVRTVKPVNTPATLAECKTDLGIDFEDHDTRIGSLIAVATDFLDVPNGAINKALITQTWTQSISSPEAGKICLTITPVQSIEAITYYDADNVEQSLDASDFYLYGDEDNAWIEPKPGVNWPAVYSRHDAITVTFKAGFGDASTDVPGTVNFAVRLLVAHWFENGIAATAANLKEIPMGVQALINMNKKGWIA